MNKKDAEISIQLTREDDRNKLVWATREINMYCVILNKIGGIFNLQRIFLFLYKL